MLSQLFVLRLIPHYPAIELPAPHPPLLRDEGGGTLPACSYQVTLWL